MRRNRLKLILAAVPVFCLIGIAVFGQQAPVQRNELGQRLLRQLVARANPMARLNNALQRAGAPVLTSEEETQLKTLIQEFRNANKPQAPGGNLQSIRSQFNEAILNQDLAAAENLARLTVQAQSENSVAQLTARANFAMAVINMLRSNSQLEPLLEWMGSNGVVQLALSLTRAPLRELPPQ